MRSTVVQYILCSNLGGGWEYMYTYMYNHDHMIEIFNFHACNCIIPVHSVQQCCAKLAVYYHIFPLLSACAYISTGRKSALNSKVHLTARSMRLTKNSYIKNACTLAVSFKGRGQSIDRSIARSVTLLHSAQVEMAFIAGRT